jgi:N-acetylmuramoyl-L-alanine amidase
MPKSLYLSAGHSNTDPGAVAHGRREADIAVEFRNLVLFYVDRHNDQLRARAGFGPVNVIRTGTDGTGTDNLPLRTAAANARSYDIAVEFHCNAAGATSATGAETLSGPKDMALGARICEALARGLDIRNRGAKPENAGQHHRLAFVQAGGIIVELFFITNPGDLARYDARKWLAARAVAEELIAAASGK